MKTKIYKVGDNTNNMENENTYSEDFLRKFEELFPNEKDKRRGDALLIQALAYLEGEKNYGKKVEQIILNSEWIHPKCRTRVLEELGLTKITPKKR